MLIYALVAIHQPASCYSLDPLVERAAPGHILERLMRPLIVLTISSRVGHQLSYLTSRGMGVWPEVWPVSGRYAWLVRPAAFIATYVPARRQLLNPSVERRAWGHVFKRLGGRSFGVVSANGYHLG